jgi:hypothetical protein
MMEAVPAVVLIICAASGVLIVALAIPLWRKRVPPNPLYGARFKATLADPAVWYPVNASGGRSLAIIGAVYAATAAAIGLVPSWNRAGALLAATGLLVIAVVVDAVRLHAFAERLLSERTIS